LEAVIVSIGNDFMSTINVAPVPKIIFGIDHFKKVSEELEIRNCENPLIVADKGVEKARIVEKVKNYLEKENFKVDTWCEITGEPVLEVIEGGIEYVRKGNYDIVIGIGGGSAMDSSKVIAALKNNPGSLKEYVIEKKPFAKKRLPLVLIPTTAGTGSEVTGDALFFVGDKKRCLGNSELIPDVGILDPMLTVSMPPYITASTGLDALSHAIEGMMTTYSNSLMDKLAIYTTKLIVDNLEIAYCQGHNLEARSNMLIAASLASIVSVNCYPSWPHSIGYTLTKRYSLPHGVSCIISLPYAMLYNLPLCEEKFSLIAEALGLNTKGLTRREKAIKAIKYIYDFIKRFNMPVSLQEIDVPKDQLNELAEECITEYNRPYNICDTDLRRMKKLYELMWDGVIE